jgi:hypothetical protein
MSGRIEIGFVDIAGLSFDVDRVRYVSMLLFLVRNWCGGGSASNAPDGALREATLAHIH